VARASTVSVVGAGRVGGAIGLALARAGYQVTAAWSLSRGGRSRAHELLDAPILEPEEVARAADIVVVAVPDDAIASVAKQIAPGIRRGKYVFHTSGGTSLEALALVREAGAHVASLHPLMTFPGPDPDALDGSAVAVTCEPRDRAAFYRVARAWGGRPFLLADDQKAAYHAAAVFASNYIVSSVWAANAIFKTIGVNNAQPLLAPLLRATLDNVIAKGPAKAITGPVARGDVNTVRQHLDTLKETDEQIANAYRAMARMTASLLQTDPKRLTA
jgi:predicted short-subunit dehydrogenase-like oxidoreductase (DUF2520 family)